MGRLKPALYCSRPTFSRPPLAADEEELEEMLDEIDESDFTAINIPAGSDPQEAVEAAIEARKKEVEEKYLYSRMSALERVKDAVEAYERYAPYWFVAKAEESAQEGVLRPYQDRYGIFQAMAQILKAPRHELEKYLDVPACPVGDLYYIENLCAVLEAAE